jgi:hypothetical protein
LIRKWLGGCFGIPGSGLWLWFFSFGFTGYNSNCRKAENVCIFLVSPPRVLSCMNANPISKHISQRLYHNHLLIEHGVSGAQVISNETQNAIIGAHLRSVELLAPRSHGTTDILVKAKENLLPRVLVHVLLIAPLALEMHCPGWTDPVGAAEGRRSGIVVVEIGILDGIPDHTLRCIVLYEAPGEVEIRDRVVMRAGYSIVCVAAHC